MAGTYSKIYVQIVFAVKGRQNLLAKEWREEVFRYIAGIINNKGQKALIVNGVGDHVHVLIGLRPAMAVADLAREIKNNSSNFINQKKLVRGRFSWQEGYGVFSYSESQVDKVFKYIENQEEHHSKTSFRKEYKDFLRDFNIDHDDKYLFDWLD